MTTDAARLARTALDRLEAGIADGDVEAVMALLTDDVVLVGTARANVGAAATREYIGMVIDSVETLRWLLDPIEVVHADEACVVVAGFGEAEFDEGHGPERSPFRLTLVLERVHDAWLVAHFHGSVPEA